MTNLTLKAQQTFSQDLYATQSTGINIDKVEEGYACCRVVLQPHHRNAMGAVMGGVMFTLADLTFAAAANSRCLKDDNPLAWVSLNSSIHYLSQPKGGMLIAESEQVKQGHTTCVFNIYIYDEHNNRTAVVTTTGIRVN